MRGVPQFIDQAGARAEDPRTEVLRALSRARASIPPKYFYDRLGSALFTAICELPEYYPTRCEASIFDAHVEEISGVVGRRATLVDLGAGDCAKAARLFDRFDPACYVAVDISVDFVREALACLQRQFPGLPMLGLGCDFTAGFALPDAVPLERRLFFYPGSSIGNFTPAEAVGFLRRLRRQCGPQAGLLLGVDLAKAKDVLEAAYDDALGVTAAFNRNVLTHVNRVAGTDFDFAHWDHVAFLNEAQSRIEMHLQAGRAIEVSWAGGGRSFAAGERIHTENSYKYRPAQVESMLREAGFRLERSWTDAAGWFGVFFATLDER
ncbi:MAG: L-histidine N(alpha)-methyltransferase [Burkholderiaceae bacterium]|nr:L-histidine N(alpha)-methyltransferase [Burkholderiaceae bacterium]